MTLAEKILFAHWQDDGGRLPERGVSTAQLRPDRVAMQDATAQMAILQFMTAGKNAGRGAIYCTLRSPESSKGGSGSRSGRCREHQPGSL